MIYNNNKKSNNTNTSDYTYLGVKLKKNRKDNYEILKKKMRKGEAIRRILHSILWEIKLVKRQSYNYLNHKWRVGAEVSTLNEDMERRKNAVETGFCCGVTLMDQSSSEEIRARKVSEKTLTYVRKTIQ